MGEGVTHIRTSTVRCGDAKLTLVVTCRTLYKDMKKKKKKKTMRKILVIVSILPPKHNKYNCRLLGATQRHNWILRFKKYYKTMKTC